ncbi:BspA family leucine-rich repeat surface protein, partial [Planktomarina temperata]|uniref:BspA family leucine-rich repeat surface protein n=1 Tax=Planktomarina temperata TaxID=1284658 RepID=UPI0035C7A482
MMYFFQLAQYFLRQVLAGVLALVTLLATPAAGQFLSDGVTPVTPIPNSNATLRAHIGSCLAEQPVTGLCTTWGDNSGFGAIPSWDVSNVTNFDHAFNIKTTFNGDISRWDMSNATSLKLMFGQAYVFNQDISQWDVGNVANFDGTFYATGFNRDISGWDVTSGTNFNNMFQQAGRFNHDIRKWDVRPGATFTNMFLNTTAMTATYGTHPYYSQNPRREFFYAADVETLESVEFPTEPSATINFSRTTNNHNATVPDRNSIDIKVRPTEFDNVGHPNSTVTINGSAVLTPDAQGYVTHTVPITATFGVSQAVPIVVTAPDGVSQRTYTINLSVNFINNANIRSIINSCLAEAPVTGLCTNYSATSGHPVMPNWNVSNVTIFDNAFNIKTAFNGDISRWDMSNATSLKL